MNKAIFILYAITYSLSQSVDPIDYGHQSIQKGIKTIWGIAKNEFTLHKLDTIEAITKGNGKFFECNNNDTIIGHLYIGRVSTCRSGGCDGNIGDEVIAGENFEYFDYFILFNLKKEIELVRVFNYQATHGYEITSKHWLRQFQGYAGEQELEYDKDIDAISGATISAISILVDIENTVHKIKEISLNK